MEDTLTDLAARAKQIRGGPAHEAVAGVLKKRIMLGGFASDDRLPTERELASILEVSRNTVRRAVRQLADEGVVSTTLGRSGGTRVIAGELTTLGEREQLVAEFATALDAHMEYRGIVEPTAARLAAQRATVEARDAIEEALAQPADDLASYHRADTMIHLSIARASGNSVLAEAIASARAQMFADTNVLWFHSDWSEVYSDAEPLTDVLRRDHARIVEAITRSDAAGAEQAMRTHLRESHAQFTTLLDSIGGLSADG